MNIRLPETFLVTSHTKYVGPESTFVAVKGHTQNGTAYIPTALNKGATTIVVAQDEYLSDDILRIIAEKNAELVRVENTRKALAQLSAQAYNYPARKLQIIAITGTKGKTTTSWMLAHLLAHAGKKTALLSTVRNRILGVEFGAELTTPQPDYIHAFLDVCVQQGVEWVVMETAAQADSLHRIQDIEFAAAAYTNFSPTHAEFYQSVDDYFAAKKNILNQVKKTGHIIINGDDHNIAHLAANFQNAHCIGEHETYRPLVASQGIAWRYYHGQESYDFECPSVLGAFNITNFSLAITLALRCSISISVLQEGSKTFAGVPGRLEHYRLPNGAHCYIDYAHTPSSFGAVLNLLRSMTQNLIVVFGAGGDRDRTMRPRLGSVATDIADSVILTTDNPRSEQPSAIIADIMSGIDESKKEKVIIEPDRLVAICRAYALTAPGSIVVLLGKGPDEYQIVGSQKIPFSERSIVTCLR